MSSLDLDYEVLCDDYDRLVALESYGAGLENPAVRSIARRWALDVPFVAGESSAMMERAQFVADDKANGSIPGRIARKAAGVTARGAGKVAKGAGRLAGKGAKAAGGKVGQVSGALAMRFKDFASELAKEQADKVKEAVNKATILEKTATKIRGQLDQLDEQHKHPVYTGGWTSKVCLEDKVNVGASIEFANHIDALEAQVQQYTVHTRSFLKSKKETDSGELKRIGKSTNWAIKRAAGLLGIVNPFKEVEAVPFAGNVIVVTHHSGRVQWAVAKDGDYGETLPQLSKSECQQALTAAEKVIKTLRDRGVKRKAVGYSGVYDEVQSMQAELEHLDGKELREATQRYKNALALEDAFTTALVRVAEGLLEFVKRSIKDKE